MRPVIRHGLLLLFGAHLLALAQACVVPSDESGSVFVTVESRGTVVGRGSALHLQAKAWGEETSGPARPLEGVAFVWSNSAPSIATVSAGPFGSATVTGVRSGSFQLTATAVDYEDATPGTLTMRVANSVEVDSVLPDTVRFGEQVTVYGVGMGAVSRVVLGEGSLIPDTASLQGEASGFGSMRFWVPPSASTGRAIIVAAHGLSASAPGATVVVPSDLYESEIFGSRPTILLDGPPVRPPHVLFFNPGLYLEPQEPFDEYLFRRSIAGPLTVVMRMEDPEDFALDASVRPENALDGGDWGVTRDSVRCRLTSRSLPRFADSLVVVVSGPASQAFVVVVRDDEGRGKGYTLEVRDGRPAPDSRITQDRYEPNDNCIDADARAADPAYALDLSQGPAILKATIDHGSDLDWYRFIVPERDTTAVTVRVRSVPLGAADPSHVAVLVGKVDDPDTESGWLEGATDGLPGAFSGRLAPGEYYALVHDGSVATPYELCVTAGVVCPSE